MGAGMSTVHRFAEVYEELTALLAEVDVVGVRVVEQGMHAALINLSAEVHRDIREAEREYTSKIQAQGQDIVWLTKRVASLEEVNANQAQMLLELQDKYRELEDLAGGRGEEIGQLYDDLRKAEGRARMDDDALGRFESVLASADDEREAALEMLRDSTESISHAFDVVDEVKRRLGQQGIELEDMRQEVEDWRNG